MRRLLLKALAALTALLVVVAVGAYVLLRRSLPSVNGEAAVAGLAAPLDVVRDADNCCLRSLLVVYDLKGSNQLP